MALRKALLLSLFIISCAFLQSCEEKKDYKTTGFVEANLFYLASPIGGYLKKLNVHEGDVLNKDQAILTLEGQKNLTAPAKSTVVEILYQKDEYVPAGYPILSLLIQKNMRIIFYVPEEDLNKIQVGKTISVIVQNTSYRVKVTTIANQAEYTPDNIYGNQNRYKLIYKIKTEISQELQALVKSGQPVSIDYA